MESKYNLDFTIDKSGMPKISVSKAGITFSKECIELLGFPKKVNIGLDSKNFILGVKAAENDITIKAYDFVTNEKRKNWLRINSKALLEEIAKAAKTNITTESIPFLAQYDEDEKILIFNLRKNGK